MTGMFVRVSIQTGTGRDAPAIGVGVAEVKEATPDALHDAILQAAGRCATGVTIEYIKQMKERNE